MFTSEAPKRSHSSAIGRPTRFSGRRVGVLVATSLILVTGLSACGGGASTGAAGAPPAPGASTTVPDSLTSAATAGPAITTGRRVASLDFTVAPAAPAQSKSGAAGETPVVGAPSAEEAVSALLGALTEGDADGAWAMLGPVERDRVGYKERMLADAVAAGWKSFTIITGGSTSGSAADGTADRATVTAEITQTAKVSDIDGVIAPSATVTFPTVDDNGSFTVNWTRRRVDQHLPERTPASDREVERAVIAWATARQNCAPADSEYVGGLIGVVGLATRLCDTTGTPTVTGIGDLDSLDEPQPIIDGFGGSALVWARVVTLKTPVAMNVVVAPDGPDWTVVGIARPSVTSS